jgi:hypothetical protein
MLAVISLMVLVSKDREKYLDRHTYLYLGLGAGLGPVIYFRITEDLYSYYLIIFGFVLLFLVLHNFKKLKYLSHLFFNVGLFLGLLVALFTYRAGDTWVEGGIEKNDPTVNSIINLSGIGLIPFLAVVFGMSLIIKFKKELKTVLVKLNFFDEFLSPNSYDDHDISYRAYKELNKVSGLYWINYDSEPEWGTGRQKNQNIHRDAHTRNSKIIIERHSDVLNGVIKNEDRDL